MEKITQTKEMSTTQIEYRKGDIFNYLQNFQDQPTILVHVCNDLGIMGGGIALTIRQKFPKVYRLYSEWHQKEVHKGKKFLPLGETQFVYINPVLDIANMIGQHGITGTFNSKPPIRYEAVENCLEQVAKVCKIKKAQMIGPKFGAGLAGGDWNIIEKLIQNKLCKQNIPVIIFEL
jgi:O-acetyl-ADP-ribose deacetylase (regulator of RNase III)